jgi:hypothetical protein
MFHKFHFSPCGKKTPKNPGMPSSDCAMAKCIKNGRRFSIVQRIVTFLEEFPTLPY